MEIIDVEWEEVSEVQWVHVVIVILLYLRLVM